MQEPKVRIFANYRLVGDISLLLEKKTIIIDDGSRSKQIAKTLSPLRNDGRLLIGYDGRQRKSVMVINGVKSHIERKRIGGTIFDIVLESLV